MSDKFGLVTWDEEVQTGNASSKKKDDWMKLQSGSNRVRLVTKPFQYWMHKYKEEGDKGFGKKIRCSAHHGTCALCELKDKRKRRWYVGVIDRKDGMYKILDMGVAIYQKVQGYNRDEDWGDPTQYDLDIVVDKNGGATGYYNVIPKPKSPLSDQDIEKKQEADLEGLKRRCAPPSPETTQKLLDEYRAERGHVVTEELDVVENDNDDDDDIPAFPPADAQSASA